MYHRKYTKDIFLSISLVTYQSDLRKVFENVAYTFINTGIVKFDWLFTKPITLRAIVKLTPSGGTILRITNIKNRQIAYREAKKYMLHSKSKNGSQKNELTLHEEVEGTTDNTSI